MISDQKDYENTADIPQQDILIFPTDDSSISILYELVDRIRQSQKTAN